MNLKKIFTLLIIAFPILYIYNSGILSLSIADIFLIILFPFLIVDMIVNKKRIKVSNILLGISFLIIIQTGIYFLFGISSLDSILTTLRVILYYTSGALFIKEYFDYKFGIKCLKVISLIAAVYWLIQYILFNMFNIFIQGTIPGLKTEVDLYNSIMNAHLWTSYAYARPRSFFSEPSHFAVYEALSLLIYVYEFNSKDKKNVIIIMLSLFLSGSGMAMILLSIIFAFAIIKNLKKITKRKLSVAFLICMILVLLFPAYSKTNAFNTFYNRTFVEKDSTNGRFGNFKSGFSENNTALSLLFGKGIYKIADIEGQNYITSIPRVYTYFGIAGFIIFILVSTRNFMKYRGEKLAVWILLFSIFFASEIMFHNLIVVFLPFLLREENQWKKTQFM